MPHPRAFRFLFVAAAGAFVLSAAMAQQQPAPAYGPSPNLQKPEQSRIPTINWATGEPWPEGKKPKAATGLAVNAFAQGLKHPRWIYVLPNGDVLVAEASTEPSPSWSPRALIQNYVQRQARAV